ncbi:hypothetical protein Z043_106657 [Scleropages formosus]|uniref:Uncharacterized protein n=1 Tax=Scleropages formosus TaxID=113540 RepID=A0A0P7Z1B4_SCLFO|nr:hypothetical protein Z043_106657 [Scleropages formosus]
MDVRAWDDPLLVSVLKGQNVKGERHHRGKREVLHEPVVVVEARVQKLKEENKFRELSRYLRAVRSDNKVQLRSMKDHVPFYLCKAGDYFGAMNCFFASSSQTCCVACRLSPAHFVMYMKTLVTGRMPAGSDPILSTQWEAAKDSNLPKKSDVIKCALRIMNWNITVFMDQYPRQALLLLVTQALIDRITYRRMMTFLSVVMAFKENAWALRWLYNGLGPETLHVFMSVLLDDLYSERNTHFTRKFELSDEQYIGDFLCYHIQDPRPMTYGTKRYVFDVLHKNWHERDYLWQYYLRMILQQCSHELEPETHRFLDAIKRRNY